MSFFVRALVFGFFLSKKRNYYTHDSYAYHSVAKNIVKGEGIKDRDDKYDFYRVPGYAVFLSFLYKTFGCDEVKTLWIQVFLASFIPLLIFLLSLSLFPTNLLLAKISSFYSCFHLGYVLFSGFMMTESLFSLFFLLFLIVFLSNFNLFFCKRSFSAFSYKNIFLSGVFLGISSLIRPIGHYLVLLIISMFLFENTSFLKKTKKTILFLGGWIVIVSSWLLRNYLLTGYIFFHTLPGVHFLLYSAVPIDMNVSGRGFAQSYSKICDREWGDLIKKDEKRRNRKLMDIEKCIVGEKLAFSYMIKYPFIAIKRAVYNICKTMSLLYSYDFLDVIGERSYLDQKKENTFLETVLNRYLLFSVKNKCIRSFVWVEILLLFFILIGFLCFIWKSFFYNNLLCITLKIFPIFSFMLFITFATGFARLRLPLEPFMIILSFNFWINCFNKSNKETS